MGSEMCIRDRPQVVLGIAFGWGIPMAFAAETETVPAVAWWLLGINTVWSVIYDTQYAMVDRDDDLKIGIKSTAVFFGQYDKLAIAALHALCIAILIWVGLLEQLGTEYYLGLAGAVGLFGYQQWLIRDRQREGCFKAFLNNHVAELLVLLGIIAAYW